jgi:hypothetical protein
MLIHANGIGMAFIVLRRTRGTRGYYLIESYRDERGTARKRTLCYLGREQDGTDTLDKAITHWERVIEQLRVEVRAAKGDRKAILRHRREAALSRIGIMKEHVNRLQARESEIKRREAETELAKHWQAFEWLRRHPTPEHAQAAKRAFLTLAKHHHPDQGGSHDDFLRLKETYDRAKAAWRSSGHQ